MTVSISVSGTGISATVAPGGTFVLNGVPAGDVTLRFTGPGVDARATISAVQEQEQIRIVVHVTGTQATVNITDRQKPQNGVELEGLIASLNASARTLVVNGVTVNVPTGAVIRHGDKTFTLTDLKVGQRVHVKGTQNGSAIDASEVKLQDQKENEEAEAEGTISALSGSCPSLTFMVKTTKVTTSASTKFKGTPCAQVLNGMKAEVEGMRQTDGSIAATSVGVERQEAEVEGTVSGLSGSCPSLTFMIGTTKVTTSASTQFKDTSCSQVKNGMKVEVKGVRQADGSIAATRVERDD